MYDHPAGKNIIDRMREFVQGNADETKDNMEALSAKPVEQHLIEMRSNKEGWRRRPLLRAVYGRFYEKIRKTWRQSRVSSWNSAPASARSSSSFRSV